MGDASLNVIMDLAGGSVAKGSSARNDAAAGNDQDSFAAVFEQSQTALKKNPAGPATTEPGKQTERQQAVKSPVSNTPAKPQEKITQDEAEKTSDSDAGRELADASADSGQDETNDDSTPDQTEAAALTASQVAAEEPALDPELLIPLQEPEDVQPDRELTSVSSLQGENEDLASQLAGLELEAPGFAVAATLNPENAPLQPLTDEQNRNFANLANQAMPKTVLESLIKSYGGKAGQEQSSNPEKQLLTTEVEAMTDSIDSELSEVFENLESGQLKQLIESTAQQKALLNRQISADGIIDQLTGRAGEGDLYERLALTSPLTQGARIQPAVMPTGTAMIDAPLTDSQWGNELAKRISFFLRGQVQQAEIRLNPPELGPVNVRINLNQDQANVTFAAQHQVVREAIESALPRLRELLSDSGFQLANADVGSHFQQQRERSQSSEDDDRLSPALLPEEDGLVTELPMNRGGSLDRLVDYFA